MKSIIEHIFTGNWKSLEVNFEDFARIKSNVPRKPGMYSILTNTPKHVLKQFNIRNDKMHYNLNKKIEISENIPDSLRINQVENEIYCVYNGHHHNLRQRLTEHFVGTKGTGCLALFEIQELRNYAWKYEYYNLSEIIDYKDSKVLRTLIEQQIRCKSGWPILCSQ
jgi:hypothetical protein